MGSITVRLPDELHEQLKAQATAGNRSVSALVIARLSASEIEPVLAGELERSLVVAKEANTKMEAEVQRLRAVVADGHSRTLPGKQAELEATLAARDLALTMLTKERDQWRDRAKAIVSAGAGVPIPRVDAVATKTIGHHAAGPILPATGLNVSGQTTTTRFRAGSEAEKSLKSWQK